MLQWHFKVVNADGHPKICVPQQNKTKKYFYPEEISGMILEKMKTIAENYLECPVTKAVVTVPAYFNDNQRQATIDAAKIAGLEVLKIMNEPTAAAFAYILKNGLTNQASNTLVFDLGGGTFDVSIINTDGTKFTVIAVNGDPDLGGADFDMLLYNYIVSVIKKEVNEEVTFKPETSQRIKAQCVRIKEQLSDAMSADFDLPSLLPDYDLLHVIKREEVEKLIRPLMRRIMNIIKETLSDAKMAVIDIDNVVLVGGSSKIPILRKELQDFFKKDLSFAVNAEEAVACGAAYQAAILNKNEDAIIKNIAVVDVTPFSLGIETEHVFMDILIKKNTPLPTTFTKLYTTVMDNQDALRIVVYQGEHELAANNTKLGYFDLTGIPPAPARKPQIYVTFSINTNGVLQVTATETSTRETKKMEVIVNTGRISEEKFVEVVQDNKDRRRKEKLIARAAEEKNKLLKLCFEAKRTVKNKDGGTEEHKFLKITEEVIRYLENLTLNETSYEEILAKKENFQKRYNEIV
ncbi:hypothetical protein ILUMI_13619 [Ignelater luminosus]|uniref:Heat shock protein 70 n=1 Tax=Ignelater luminosus TaxID=2038154 RepID=A0A8K0GAR2_IGNLU|nr:hypothetical protein ILUMI_13619 [Ignelater luminosus]